MSRRGDEKRKRRKKRRRRKHTGNGQHCGRLRRHNYDHDRYVRSGQCHSVSRRAVRKQTVRCGRYYTKVCVKCSLPWGREAPRPRTNAMLMITATVFRYNQKLSVKIHGESIHWYILFFVKTAVYMTHLHRSYDFMWRESENVILVFASLAQTLFYTHWFCFYTSAVRGCQGM